VEIDATTIVSKVIGGDTFDTTSEGRIRLADVDTPEKGESGYYEAKNFLNSLVNNKQVYLDIDDVYETDKYGRLICVVYVSHNTTHFININKALLVEDYAVIWNFDNEFNPYAWTLYCQKEEPTPSDTTPPAIFLLSPQNKTYSVTDISMTFSVDESTSWIGYSLDSQANVTIGGNTTIANLADSSHSLIVYAKDTSENLGSSEIIYFTVEIQQPELEPEPRSEPFIPWYVALIVMVAGVVLAFVVYFTKTKRSTSKV
jgi:hypothetical protein